MTLVYTNKKDGRGRCIDPKVFSTPARGARLVYTDDANIRKAYEALGIKVKPLKEKK